MKKLEADLACPQCKRKFRQRIDEMVPGRTRSCPYCGLVIKFSGDDGRKAQRALDDLERTFKDIARRLR